MSTPKTSSLASITGRDEFIIGEALATALIALEQLPRKMAVHAQRAAAWSARRLSRASIEYAATTKTGETMTEPAEKSELIVYENVDTAPFVYFDISPTHGILGGAIQIELAARILNAVPDGGVEIKFITTGRLRCSPTAALNLRNAIDAVLKMLEQQQQSPVAAAKMN